jgi:hypothetical protein
VKITLEQKLTDAVVEAFYPLYAAAWEPIRTRAAARHLLTAEEFAEEMIDERIDKYVVWNDDDQAVALTTVATDLAAVPWISPEYYRSRYPQEAARGALYYMGYTLVDPENAGKGAFLMMMDALQRRLNEERAVCGADICAFNQTNTVGRRFHANAEFPGVEVLPVDTQTYYAVTFQGIPYTTGIQK